MAKLGRPTVYSEEIAEEICDRLARGEGLATICRDSHLPAESTVRGWALHDEPGRPWEGFFARYAAARELQAARMFDELLTISDETCTYVDPTGTTRVDGGGVQRNRLRVDTRKWYLSKVLPKLYGERSTVALTGPSGEGPIEVARAEEQELLAQVDALKAALEAQTRKALPEGDE